MILQPNGAPARKRQEQLSRQDVKTVVEFEQWCRAHGIALDLYCNRCANEHGARGARMWANNSRYDDVYHLECQCTDRVYGRPAGTVAQRPNMTVADPKIQVLVP